MRNFDAMLQYSGVRAATRAAEKRGAVLRWVWLWGLTDRYMVGQLLDLQRDAVRKTTTKLLRSGLIAQVRIEGMPTPALHMTPAGATAIAPSMDGTGFEDMTAVVYPSRLNAKQAQHDLLIQRVVWNMARRVPDLDYETDRMMRFAGRAIVQHGKLPDALVTLPLADGTTQTWALEVYETLPPPDQRERIISAYAEAAMPLTGETPELYGTIYASTNPAILRALEATARGPCRRWIYASVKHRWHVLDERTDPVTDEYLETRVQWQSLERYAASLYQYAVL